jgi:PD-(D/E)XK nuclease-like transposase
MTFINPKIEFALKKLLGSNDSKPILISFLNAMIYDGNPTIADLEIIDPYLASRVPYLKDSYLDVKARLAGGATVITALCVTKRYSNSSEQNNFRFAYLNISSLPIPIVFLLSVYFEVQIS